MAPTTRCLLPRDALDHLHLLPAAAQMLPAALRLAALLAALFASALVAVPAAAFLAAAASAVGYFLQRLASYSHLPFIVRDSAQACIRP